MGEKFLLQGCGAASICDSSNHRILLTGAMIGLNELSFYDRGLSSYAV